MKTYEKNYRPEWAKPLAPSKDETPKPAIVETDDRDGVTREEAERFWDWYRRVCGGKGME